MGRVRISAPYSAGGRIPQLTFLALDLAVRYPAGANNEPLRCGSHKIERIAGYKREGWRPGGTKNANGLRIHHLGELDDITVFAVPGYQTNLVIPANQPQRPEKRVTVAGDADVSNAARLRSSSDVTYSQTQSP